MKTAVIDIGSNSVRYALLCDDAELTPKEINSTVLADGLFFSGALKDGAITRTVAAVAAFCRKAKAANADEIFLFATEAVRTASNGKAFTDAVKRKTGLTVDVIDGVTEAKIGFLGCKPAPDTCTAVFDIGGASCEIVCGKENNLLFTQSMPFGCVRLCDGANGNKETALSLIEQALPDTLPAVDCLVGIGGTATALGAMAHCPAVYIPEKVHNGTVNAAFCQTVASDFFAGKDLRRLFPCLTLNRARVIGYGALAALGIMNRFGFSQFTVSERDNMEGYVILKHL